MPAIGLESPRSGTMASVSSAARDEVHDDDDERAQPSANEAGDARVPGSEEDPSCQRDLLPIRAAAITQSIQSFTDMAMAITPTNHTMNPVHEDCVGSPYRFVPLLSCAPTLHIASLRVAEL